jgi:hypothetical protein
MPCRDTPEEVLIRLRAMLLEKGGATNPVGGQACSADDWSDQRSADLEEI